jgi:hypothetical protein
MLLSDEQRDNACALLRDEYGAGRMTLEDYSARIDKVLAARDTNQVSLAFKGLETPAWLAPRPVLPQLVPSWVTAVSGLVGVLDLLRRQPRDGFRAWRSGWSVATGPVRPFRQLFQQGPWADVWLR